MFEKLKSTEKYLVYLLLFLLPTQLAFHFWPSFAFVFGIRVDLLAPTLYLTDLLVLILVVFNFRFLLDFKKLFIGILFFAILNIVFSTSLFVSSYKWLKVIEFVFVSVYFAKSKLIDLQTVVKTILLSMVTFSLIGIVQFIKGGTIGGPLYYLGERSFNSVTPGIALVALNGVEHLRAYSTFSHPNSLGGFLAAGLIFVLLSGKLKKNIFSILGILTIFVCVFLTFSLSTYLGIGTVTVFYLLNKYLISKSKNFFMIVIISSLILFVAASLFLPVVSSLLMSYFPKVGESVGQRLDLAFISGKMISQKFLIGEGLGSFIVNIPTYKGIFSYSWLLQPVHNIFLLVFAETGIMGLLIFVYLVFKTLLRQIDKKLLFVLLPLMLILFTGLFDHYSLTLQQNIFLFSIFIGITFRDKIA